jgi:hypothetical protein
MMSTTGTFHGATPRAPRTTGWVGWLAVATALSLATSLVASAKCSMIAVHTSEADGAVASSDADAITRFGPIRSHLGRLHGEVISHPVLLSGTDQSWTVRLTTPAGTGINGVPVTVEAYMPVTGDRMPTRPVARYIGDGQYRIEGLRFTRAGWWNVGLAVRFAFGGDSLAFNLILAR